MFMEDQIDISSFIIRFTECKLENHAIINRGLIRHIQSNKELKFKSWDEAVDFMKIYVPLPLVKTKEVEDQDSLAETNS